MTDETNTTRFRFWRWLIRFVGLIVPRRLRADWRQEWEAELQYRELLLAEWDKLDGRNKLDLLRRSLGAFWDAARLQPKRWEDEMWQDLRFGARMLAKQPGFALLAVVTLALGIGANTAIFSVVNAALLRPLPYVDARRLVVLESGDRTKGAQEMGGLSPGNFWELAETPTKSFAHVAGVLGSGYSFTQGENPESVPGVMVTPNFFQVLPVRPLYGRLLAESDACDGCPGALVLSHRLWLRRFGGDPGVVGRVIDAEGAQIVGVLPPDFSYPERAEVWRALPRDLQVRDRASRYFQAYGLLNPGVTMEQARGEIHSLAAQWEQSFPKENKNLIVAATPFRERMTRDVRMALWVLLGAVGAVLAVACANVANLLLARAVARRHELAIRAALGAGRGRIVRQLLSEGLLLAGLGAALGWLLAQWAQTALIKLLPESYAYLRLPDHLRADWRVLAFTIGATALTTVLFGLLPAWQATRAAVGASLKEGGRGGEKPGALRGLFVVAEVALALVLLIGAGLLFNSFLRLQRVPLGFDPNNLFSLQLSIPINQSQAEKVERIRQFQTAVAALPDVEAVAVTTGFVFPFLNFQLNRPDKPLPAAEPVLYDAISANYFATLRGALLKGRALSEQDTAGTEAVAVINEALARRLFADEDPLEKLVTLNYLGRPQQRRVVGVVRDLNQGDLVRLQPQLYVPYAQQTWFGTTLLVRARGSVTAARRAAQAALWAIDPKQPVSKDQTAAELLGEKLGEPRLYTALLGLFAALGLALAAIGIIGVMSYHVTQRTNEIGIRMALGAQGADVLRLIVGQGMKLVLLGVGAGLLGALLVTRALKTLLFGVTATDPLTFAGVGLLLMLVALLACYLPARRATKVDPLIALRRE